MPCSRYDLYYGGTAGAGNGVLSATYYNCGDRTPFNLTVTGGTSGAYYGQIIATTDYGYPLKTYTGYASAGGASIGGFVYTEPVSPWAQYVLSSSVSALSAHGLPYPAN